MLLLMLTPFDVLLVVGVGFVLVEKLSCLLDKAAATGPSLLLFVSPASRLWVQQEAVKERRERQRAAVLLVVVVVIMAEDLSA
jgi:hypothetical protein